MKTIAHSLKLQRGVASLLTAIVLLTSITLVVLFTSKTVLTETKMAADDYRTSQATAAAQAAMDQGFAYYGVSTSFDQNGNGVLDYALAGGDNLPLAITLTSGSQTTRGQFYFDNASGNICASPATLAMDKGRIVATGWSDDNTATRTISLCVDKAKILKDDGPSQPYVTQGSVGIAGNGTFINRFTNTNIWTGGDLGVNSASFATYLSPLNVELTWEEKIAGCPNPCSPASGPGTTNVRLISNRDAGYGVDVIGGDPTLGNLSPTEMFAFFFGSNTKAMIKARADSNGQMFTTTAAAAGKSGLIWIEGSGSSPNIGVPPSPLPPAVSVTPAKPAILVVNGDFTIGAGTKIYGIVYVTGTLTVNGSPDIYGTIISEAGHTSGSGSPTIVYVPWFKGECRPSCPTDADPTPIPGSWRDW